MTTFWITHVKFWLIANIKTSTLKNYIQAHDSASQMISKGLAHCQHYSNFYYDKKLQLYLKNCESEGMSQVFWRLENLLPVVSVQIDAAQHVQLGVHPVQSSFDQIYENEHETLIAQGDRVVKQMHNRWTQA